MHQEIERFIQAHAIKSERIKSLNELQSTAYNLCKKSGWGLKYELAEEDEELRIILPRNIFENIDEIQRENHTSYKYRGGKWNPYCGKI
jgi:hypothetical protein